MKKTNTNKRIEGSFRDPIGFLYYQNGSIYRQVNKSYRENFNHLVNSSLYKTLVNDDLLIPHEDAHIDAYDPNKAFKIISPEEIPFISYPYEWCFSQLKGAALATLKIQKIAFEHGMCLKDCSAYNIQFRNGKPLLIDTLSFEIYQDGQPWAAYRQFCQYFFAPLVLMCYKDIRLNQLLRNYIDGIPLDLTNSLIPLSARFNLSILFHITLHAKSQKFFSDKTANIKKHKVNRMSFLGLIDNLESAISKLKWQAQGSQWGEYYTNTNYSEKALQHKKQLISEFVEKVNPNSVWDIGGNEGVFSRIASDQGIQTISFDIDHVAVEKNYLNCIKNGERNILPLLLDLTNPSPNIGWKNQERMSLINRGPADTVFALALIHHLVISNNLPLYMIADFFSSIGESLVIEFVPTKDSQVQRLLATRKDITHDYTQEVFEQEFRKFFSIQRSEKIRNSERTLYLMIRKQCL